MADTLDVLTLTEAKAALNIDVSKTGQDTDVALFVTAVSRRLDEALGPIVHRTISGEEHTGATAEIHLRHYPVASVTTITEYHGTTAQALALEDFPDTLTANDYRLVDDGRWGRIQRRTSGRTARFADPVVVTYVAGRAATTAAVDARLKLTAGSVLRRLWDREKGAWAKATNPFDAADDGARIRFFNAVDAVLAEQVPDELDLPMMA